MKSYLGFAIKGNKVIFGYDKLYENKIGLLEMIVAETDETKKETLKFALDLVNSYIDICEKRNKF